MRSEPSRTPQRPTPMCGALPVARSFARSFARLAPHAPGALAFLGALATLVALVTLAAPAEVSAAPRSGAGLALPEARRVTLDNGATVLLIPHREVPLIAFEVVVRGGTVLDPAGKEGLASFTAAMLRKGAAGRTAEQLADHLDGLGGTLSISVDEDAAWIGLELLSRDAAAGVELLGDLVMRPDFPVEQVEKLRARAVDGIRAAKEEPLGVLPTYFAAALFGDHPYGRPGVGTEQTVAGFTRDDVATFHAAHWGGDRLLIAVGGDFDLDAMERALRAQFGAWTKAGEPLPAVHPPTAATGRRVVLVDVPGATQTYFAIGNVGQARTQKPREALDLVHVLFGGRFTSMLNTALRIESGLTYGARLSRSEHVEPGSVAITSYSETDKTGEAIDLALATLARLRADGVTDAAIASAKAYTRGQLPTRLETAAQVTEKLAELAFFGMTPDAVDGYLPRMDAVTAADVRAAIDERMLRPDDLIFVLLGDATRIRAVAAKYGPVVEKKIGDPGF